MVEYFGWPDEECDRCGSSGEILVCPDDICQGQSWCMHGDGEIDCPKCLPEELDQ
jgi:hypothetical protein